MKKDPPAGTLFEMTAVDSDEGISAPSRDGETSAGGKEERRRGRNGREREREGAEYARRRARSSEWWKDFGRI